MTEIGFPAIHAHDADLAAYAFLRLAEIPGLTIYGPEPPQRGPIISFSIEGIHPQDLAPYLDMKGVAVRHGHHCTMPLHELLGVPATTRASFGVYSSRGDVDVLVDAIQFAAKETAAVDCAGLARQHIRRFPSMTAFKRRTPGPLVGVSERRSRIRGC